MPRATGRSEISEIQTRGRETASERALMYALRDEECPQCTSGFFFSGGLCFRYLGFLPTATCACRRTFWKKFAKRNDVLEFLLLLDMCDTAL